MGIGGQTQFPHVFGHHGASLEHLVLTNSKQYFKTPPTEKWKAAATIVGQAGLNRSRNQVPAEDILNDAGDDESANCCNKKWCWWSPAQDKVAVSFCNETSIHGLLFMGQPKRHITERIFWLIAFLLSLAAAIYLIHGVWDRHHRIPVIVSFQAKEQDIDSIPFPAVTLCNMNKFPKSKVDELYSISKIPSHKKYNEARQQLTFVRSVCNAQQSFAKKFDYAYNRGTNEQESDNDTITEDNQDEMMDFLLQNTLPCDEFIRLCMLGEEIRNCSDLFRPIITDYGKCCTFNILPLPLLLKNPQNANKTNASLFDNPALGNNAKTNWPQEEIEKWQKWKYDEGFVIDKNLNRPWKQKRAGMPYGLSILVDPNIGEYYCPVSDSEGVRFILHTPLEMPHVMEFASVADVEKEILIEVHPDMTNADDDIRDFDRDKRQCYFGVEKTLKFFGPYTGGNCIDECTARVLGEKCKCTFFYMPRDDGVKICNNDPDSDDHRCIETARIDLQATLKDTCGHCDSLCEDIAYNYETTIVHLQKSATLWGNPDIDPKTRGGIIPHWANHKMSILHIFFGSETTVPKQRKRLYGTTDLIANTGGILGLCLGFSVLSGVEVLYFLTIRAFWRYCRRRRIGRRVANRFTQMFKSKSEKVIRVNPNQIPVYPYPPPGNDGFPPGGKGQFFGSNTQYNMYSQTPYAGNVGYY